jgi:hypothetical protein
LDCSTEGLAGSADLIAELRLSNAQIVDRDISNTDRPASKEPDGNYTGGSMRARRECTLRCLECCSFFGTVSLDAIFLMFAALFLDKLQHGKVGT